MLRNHTAPEYRGVRRSLPGEPAAAKPSRWRVFLVQLVLLHGALYASIIAVLFVINVLTGIMTPWFLFPALGWGAFLAMHAFTIYLLLNIRIARGIVTRAQQGKQGGVTYRPKRVENELPDLVTTGHHLLEQMHAAAKTIPTLSVRHQVFDTCRASAQVLAAIEEHPGEVPLARDFIHRFLEPASLLVRDYARLVNRPVPSAEATLRAVETHDFPRLTARATAMLDRVHRGTLIDLQVAREMMVLDTPDVLLPDAGPQESRQPA